MATTSSTSLSVPNESSRQSTPGATANGLHYPPRKRRNAASTVPEASPAPSDSANTGGTTATANVTLPARHDFFSRPRLTISRFPTFQDSPNVTYHTTEQLAMNRLGFRYMPAGVAPAGSALPCRTIESGPAKFRVSWEDRSTFIKVTPDGLGLLGERGFRSARCNAPIREGAWYMEVRIECGGGERPPDAPDVNMREGSHVRLGWARREAPLNGPVGLDGYSYGYRDKTGDKVHVSRPRGYGRTFRSGDVIGMYIFLPPRRKPDPADPHDPAHLKRERIPIEFKGQEYFESLEYAQSKEMIALMEYSHKAASTASLPSVPGKKSVNAKSLPERKGSGPETPVLRPLPQLRGSHIAFFVNGECQKIAFNDLFDYLPLRRTSASRKDKENTKKRAREGAPREHKENPYDDGTLGYYPFISLFNYARVRINPGPDFEFPPPPDIEALLRKEDEDIKPSLGSRCTEEEEAKAEMVSNAERLKAEAAKQAQKERRKRQTEAKKRAKEAETRQASVRAVSIPRTSIEQEAVADFARMQLPEDVEMAHSPAPTATPSIDYRAHYAGSEYESEQADGEGEAGDGYGGQYGDAEAENRSDGVPSIDLELEELL
ncbi:hypothetical protein EDD16DRAFT_1893604 [Pisolithus croceorrhizus]|nr:hypothetical protein EDD16DRAFT_1893604 [Pisolithus croceorrhizus]